MGIFGHSSNDHSAQDEVDLGAIKDRLARLESAVASLQGQVATLTTGAAAAGGAVPYAGNPSDTSAGALPADGAWLQEVRQLKESGQLIEAIKAYRVHTNVGLKEAKDAVEGML
jgi:large subunit ribosomal protein L7/L12